MQKFFKELLANQAVNSKANSQTDSCLVFSFKGFGFWGQSLVASTTS